MYIVDECLNYSIVPDVIIPLSFTAKKVLHVEEIVLCLRSPIVYFALCLSVSLYLPEYKTFLYLPFPRNSIKPLSLKN